MRFMIIVFALLVFSCSPKIYETTKWQQFPVNADGRAVEWSVPLRFFDKTTQLNYDVSNDLNNLYLAVRTTDKNTVQKIIASGLVFSIDTFLNNQTFPFSVAYPIHGFMGHNPNLKNSQPFINGQNTDIKNPGFSDNKQTNNNNKLPEHDDGFINNQIPELMLLTGFNNIGNGQKTILASESQSIKAKYVTDNSEVLFMELIIPFDAFLKNKLLAADSLTVLTFKFAYNNLVMNDMQQGPPNGNRGKNPGGSPSGGGLNGGQMGNMMHGGMGEAPGGEHHNIPDNQNKGTKTEKVFKLRLMYK